jgi:PhnB protein
MTLAPFIYVYGKAEEALEFYKDALGGSYDVLARNQRNRDPRLDPSFVGKVAYAEFTAPGIAFGISDGAGPRELKPDEGNMILNLYVASVERAGDVFRALSSGGTVIVPFGDSPFGRKFGHLRDRFKNEWFIRS